jgi:DNA primase
MARIPEAEIERLKNEVAVQRLIEAAGIELKKSGKDWVARCPFHEDATASLVVTPSKVSGQSTASLRAERMGFSGRE